MGDLSALMVEFFGSGRLEILRALSAGTMRFTQLSKEVDASSGELSRNLNRLANAGLLDKRSDGSYALTPVAHALLTFVPRLEVIGRYREYFNAHDLSSIPPDLLLRLDDLAGARLLDDPFETAGIIEKLIRGTRRFYYGLCVIGRQTFKDEELAEFARLFQAPVHDRPDVKYLAWRDEMRIYAKLAARVARIEPEVLRSVEVRVVDRPPGSMIITDAGATLAFPLRAGRMDFNFAFHGTDERFMGWCRGFFEAHWVRATPVDFRTVLYGARGAG